MRARRAISVPGLLIYAGKDSEAHRICGRGRGHDLPVNTTRAPECNCLGATWSAVNSRVGGLIFCVSRCNGALSTNEGQVEGGCTCFWRFGGGQGSESPPIAPNRCRLQSHFGRGVPYKRQQQQAKQVLTSITQ
jgi:hypothetical protein